MPSRQDDFIRLLEAHKTLIYKVCHLYCPDPGERQDLFQEVVLQLWKSYAGFRGESKFGTWLYRVALNTAISAARRRKSRRASPLAPADLSENAAFEKAEDIQREQWLLLQKAVALLTPVEKSILMLYLDDRPYDQMEEVLGIPQANLRVKVNRIKEKLKKRTQSWKSTSLNIFGDR